MATTIPLPVRDIISPQFHQNNFSEEAFVKNELGIKLDKGAHRSPPTSQPLTNTHQRLALADDQICRLSLTPTGCPLGPQHCPLRHTTPSVLNFQPPKQLPTHPRERERLATVCKHWLRGLCKKGDACEFLHEYNLRRMPECWWYAKYGYCSAGDECLYAHPKERRVECPDYNRGFCKLGASLFPSSYAPVSVCLRRAHVLLAWPVRSVYPGPTCPRKHVRRVACQLYLTGFCPLGPDCPRGQYVAPSPSSPPKPY